MHAGTLGCHHCRELKRNAVKRGKWSDAIWVIRDVETFTDKGTR